MPLTVKNSLNRWCPRSLSSRGAIGFITGFYEQEEQEQQGCPPPPMACIAPHCHHWEAIDEEHGTCLLRVMLKMQCAGALAGSETLA